MQNNCFDKIKQNIFFKVGKIIKCEIIDNNFSQVTVINVIKNIDNRKNVKFMIVVGKWIIIK